MFGVERITEEQFRSWSRFFLENYLIDATPRGFASPGINSGLIITSGDVGDFLVQSFLQRYRGHFTRIGEIVSSIGVYNSGDTVRVSSFFDKVPKDMDFDDYVLLFRKFVDEDLAEGRFTESGLVGIHTIEDADHERQSGLTIDVRDTHKILSGGIGYVSMNLQSRTSKVYYFDLPYHNHNPTDIAEIFEGDNNPFLKHETISFIARFGTTLLPFANVSKFFYVKQRELGVEPQGCGPVGGIYSGVEYSKLGKEPLLTPVGKFSM